MAMPQRTRSKCAAGSRSVAALLAACTSRTGRAVGCGRPRLEARELLAEEASPRSSAVAKCVQAASSSARRRQGGDDRVGLLGVARAEAAHAGVELDVHARRAPEATSARARAFQAPMSAPASRRSQLLVVTRPAPGAPVVATRRSRAPRRRGHREPRRAAGQRGLRARPAPAVAVGLDHRTQRAFGACAAAARRRPPPPRGRPCPARDPARVAPSPFSAARTSARDTNPMQRPRSTTAGGCAGARRSNAPPRRSSRRLDGHRGSAHQIPECRAATAFPRRSLEVAQLQRRTRGRRTARCSAGCGDRLLVGDHEVASR